MRDETGSNRIPTHKSGFLWKNSALCRKMNAMLRSPSLLLFSFACISCAEKPDPSSGRVEKQAKQSPEPKPSDPTASSLTPKGPPRKVRGTPQMPVPDQRGDFFIYTRGPGGRVSEKLWYEAFYFSPEGYAVAQGEHGWSLIDRDEKELGYVHLIDNYPDSVQDGVIRMREGDKMRYFSLRDGQYLKGAWDYASPFDGGVACVCNGCLKPVGDYRKVEGGQSWFINDKGKILRPYTSPTPQCDLGHRKETKAWQVFAPAHR